ncbi:MAG: T9SS type A sorting domain-containing protein, partial [Bacteroidia bacterium]|nr:T9SS type A sorting domain-containing protein [Bacteroidia bacterium]
NSINVSLSNGAILYQNTPNPFSDGGTRISYFLPENTMGATMVFYDMYGNKLQETPLTQSGMGVINLNPTRLSNGIYTYSLVINGTVVDTKKMVFSK